MVKLIANWQTWVWSLVTITSAVLVGLIAHLVLYWFLRRLSAQAPPGRRVLERSLAQRTSGPIQLVLPLATTFVVSGVLRIPRGILEAFRHLLSLALIGAICWLMVRLIGVFDDVVAQHYLTGVHDNYRARSIRTQVVLMERIVTGATLLAAVAAMLMTFPSVWNLGAGLFASAGVAGLVLGMAARPALSNMLAGVQVLTEPIRIDDVVIVEGEYGCVEEVNTTYVVVRIWDKRRLIVPLTYFIEKPFQNWTRSASDLGTVLLYTDYMAPVEDIRQELERVVRSSRLWDGKVWNLQVADTKDRMLELRCMVSAVDSPTLWDLRVEVREKMIRFLQKNYPRSLPVMRAEIDGDAVRELAGARENGRL
jgi:small-conductance mechanosensitive channel